MNTAIDKSIYGQIKTKGEQLAELVKMAEDIQNNNDKNAAEAYQQGLDDAWEAARKIALMDTGTSEKVTGYFGLFRIMKNLTPMQAIAKLKAYEEKQNDKIEVGDIVERYLNDKLDSTGIYLGEDGDYWNCLFWTGTVFGTFAYPKNQFKKTGRHFDIASILEEMRND